jgi:cathepsin L
MMQLIFLILLIVIVAVSSKIVDESYSFEQYVSDFKHKWEKGTTEYDHRRSLFAAEHARVLAHSKKGLSWTEGVNKFSAMTTSEKKAFRGWSKNAASQHKPSAEYKKELPSDFFIESVANLPESVDWRLKQPSVVSPVKDQGSCGSCWAFASTAVMETHVALSSGLLFDLAPEQIAMCAPNPDSCGGTGGCQGSTAELAFEYAASPASGGLKEEYQ